MVQRASLVLVVSLLTAAIILMPVTTRPLDSPIGNWFDSSESIPVSGSELGDPMSERETHVHQRGPESSAQRFSQREQSLLQPAPQLTIDSGIHFCV